MRTVLLGGFSHLVIAALLLVAMDYRFEAVGLWLASFTAIVIFLGVEWRLAHGARSRLDLASRCFGVVARGWFLVGTALVLVDEFGLESRLRVQPRWPTRCWYCPPWSERLIAITIVSTVLGLIAAAVSPLFWIIRRRGFAGMGHMTVDVRERTR